jgi:WD40 repeat protein
VVAYNSVNRSGFTGFQLSRNSQFIVASHNPNPNNSIANISIWNIDYSKKKITLVNETRNSEAHNADILCMTISPDEKYLASMGANGILKFWRLENYTMADQLQAYPVGLTG